MMVLSAQMSERVMDYFRPTEILVILLVLVSTASLELRSDEEETKSFEVDTINGFLDLKTRSAMDSLGLDDFRPGALVEINLSARTITTNQCEICSSDPVGIFISGDVDVSGLRPINSAGQVRLEGKINVTHLQEFESENMIIREWLTIDWDLDEFSTQWDIFIEHSPPKWSLENRYDASLVNSETSSKSRVGPVIYVEELIENSLTIHGCMPNSLNCDGINREEINLTTTLTEPRKHLQVPFSGNLFEYELSQDNSSETNNLGDIRNLFDISDLTANHSSYCLGNHGTPNAIKSWNVSGNSASGISPMGLWLSSIGLPSSSFYPTNGVWTELDFEKLGCGSFTNNGDLLLSISKSSA